MAEQRRHACRRSRHHCLLALALLYLTAGIAEASQPPPGYPGQPPQQRGYPAPPQAYPPEGQPEGRPGPPHGQQQSQAPWQEQQQHQRQQPPPQQQQQRPPGYPGGPPGGAPGPRGPPPQGGYRGPPGPPQQQQQQQGPPGYGSGGYPPSYYGGRPGPGGYPPQQPPQQQQQQPQEGGIFSRLANKFRGDGSGPPQGAQQYGGQGGYQGGPPPDRYGPHGGQYRPPPSNTWQGQAVQPPGPGALTPAGPVRGPMGVPQPQRPPPPPQQQGGQYQGQQYQGQGGHEEGASWTGGVKNLFGKIFTGDAQETGAAPGAPPSFRPKGSTLAKKAAATAPPAPGYQGAPYGGYPGAPMGMGIPGAGGGQAEPQGPGKPEFVAVDDSIVFVLKPNELERKKRKFKSDGQGKLQVLTSFDGGLTGFTTKDGKSSSLRTTELLEHNQHVMLPEAAKKIRYLRSTFKRQMETEGKAMAPADRAKAVEQHLRAVFTTAAQEGGMHMSSFGPALESQMDMIPLREGVNDLLGALAYRGIPINVVCTGYGNVAIEVLRRGAPSIAGPNGALSPHLHMIANFFQSDETMSIVDLYDKVPLVHEGNKNGNMILDFHRAVRWDTMALAARSNAVVVGAELADLNLTAGLTLDDRITVGFLKMEEDFLDKFPRYAQAFDVLVVGNGDLSYVNELLYEVTDP